MMWRIWNGVWREVKTVANGNQNQQQEEAVVQTFEQRLTEAMTGFRSSIVELRSAEQAQGAADEAVTAAQADLSAAQATKSTAADTTSSASTSAVSKRDALIAVLQEWTP